MFVVGGVLVWMGGWRYEFEDSKWCGIWDQVLCEG